MCNTQVSLYEGDLSSRFSSKKTKRQKHLITVNKKKSNTISSSINQYYPQFLKSIYNNTRLTALSPGLPRSADTGKVQPIWILLKQETVVSAGPYANLHLGPDR